AFELQGSRRKAVPVKIPPSTTAFNAPTFIHSLPSPVQKPNWEIDALISSRVAFGENGKAKLRYSLAVSSSSAKSASKRASSPLSLLPSITDVIPTSL